MINGCSVNWSKTFFMNDSSPRKFEMQNCLPCKISDVLVITLEKLFDQDVLYKGIHWQVQLKLNEVTESKLFIFTTVTTWLWVFTCLYVIYKTSHLSSLVNSPHTEELVWEQACAIFTKSCMFIKTLKTQLHIPEVICRIPQLALLREDVNSVILQMPVG